MTTRIPLTVVAPAARCDCSICPFHIGNPHAVEPICSGSNTDCSYCGCARNEGPRPSCGQCPIRCGSRTDITAWMVDVGGSLAFDDIELDALHIPLGLPPFIPMVDTTDVASLDTHLGWPAYAIGLRRVFSPRTFTVLPTFAGTSAGDALHLGAGRLGVLVGYGEDPLVEGLWSRRQHLYPQLAAQHWDLVLAPNFSMYGNQPRTEHLLNFRRNLLIAAEMLGEGIPAVPNLYWFRLEDLERYATWAADTTPPAVAVNLQTFRTDSDWEQMLLPGLSFLAATLPPATRVVLTGASRAARLATLVDLFADRLVVVSQNPIQYARHGAVMTASGRQDVHAHVADAFAANVRFYASLVRTE